ncbi:TPA: STAS-like domain-containing protein [Aeromonas veronii]
MNNSKKTITIINDFSKKPFGRYPKDGGDNCGEKFRHDCLLPALQNYHLVHVILTGYNRYGRSFIDEAFGGLIREDRYKLQELNDRLTYEHADVKSIESLIKERLEAAHNDISS